MLRRFSYRVGMIMLVCAASCVSVSGQASSVTQVRSTLERWVETQQVLSKEKQEWALGREMLQERIQLLKQEIDSLQAKIAEAEETIGEADKKRSELVEENDELKKLSKVFTTRITEFETRTKQLNGRLPDPIRELIKPLSQRLPEDPNKTNLSLGIRFQNVIGILDAVNKANRDIRVTSEVRTLLNGQTAEVTALYIGLGQAYYLGSNGAIAGVGRPSEDGWVWAPDNKIAPEVAAAISILKNEKVATFVTLPVHIQ